MKIPVSLSISENTVTKIDVLRGLIPRSRYVQTVLKLGLQQIEDDPTIMGAIYG